MRAHMMERSALAAALLAWTAAAAPAQQPSGVRGRVLVAGLGEPIAGAEVRAVCHDVRTVTRADGSWHLGPLPDGPHEIVVEHVAYAHERRRLNGDAAAIDISLTPRPVSLSAVVVSAARRLQQLKDAAVATEVLDRAELRRSGAADLSAVLVERTGITLESGHPVGAGIMLQGLGSERVLVLLDGQPLLGRQSGKLDLARIATASIDQVEVIKGPQSTLYGSDAMAGVVNVITRSVEPGAWRGGLELTGGSRDRLDVAANLTGSVSDVAYAADAGRRSIELVPGYAGDAGTFATRWDGALKTQWDAASTLRLVASVAALDETQRWRSGPLYSFADNTQLGARASAAWKFGAHVITPTLYATQFSHHARRSTEPAPLDGTGEYERQRLVEAEVLYTFAAQRAIIDAGVETRRESIVSDRVHGATRVLHRVEPFAQTTFSGERWSVVPGVRLSWSEQWGTHWTPRLATLLRLTPRLSLRASLGQGYRAPSFKELYMEFLNTAPGGGYRVRGNAALQPETSVNTMASAEWAGERLYARAQLFYNRFDDFIETRELADSAGLRAFTYGNVADGSTWGSELELGATWHGLRAEAGYAYLVAEDRVTGARLLGRPTHSARASLTQAFAFGLRSSVSVVHTGRTPISGTPESLTERAAYTRFDARFAQTLPRGLELGLGIDNIANQRPQHWPEYQRRQFYVSIGWHGERPAMARPVLQSPQPHLHDQRPASTSAVAERLSPEKKTGTLIIAHGGGPAWDGQVAAVAAQVETGGPVEVSFLMGPGAASARFQDAVSKLAAAGAEQIVIVPVLVSSHSGHYEQIRYLAGEVDRLDETMMHHLHMSGIERSTARLPMVVTRAIDDAGEVARVIAERAMSLARERGEQALFLIGHGPNSAEDHAAWMTNLRTVADSVKRLTGFRDIKIGLVRDDAPSPVRAEAVRTVRELIRLQHELTGRDVVVVPVLVAKGQVSTEKLPADLAGLPILYTSDGLMPHREMARWIERRVREAAQRSR